MWIESLVLVYCVGIIVFAGCNIQKCANANTEEKFLLQLRCTISIIFSSTLLWAFSGHPFVQLLGLYSSEVEFDMLSL